MKHPTDDELEALVARLEDGRVCSPAQNHCRNGYLMLEAAAMLRACKGRVRVKPLEWRSIGRDRVAETMIGEYVVSLDVFQVGGTAYLWVAGQVYGDDHHSEHKNMYEAKAAAQADYEARILAALDPAPDHAEKQAYIEGTQSGWDAALQAARNACMKLRHSDDLENDDQRVGVLECVLAIVELKKGPPND